MCRTVMPCIFIDANFYAFLLPRHFLLARNGIFTKFIHSLYMICAYFHYLYKAQGNAFVMRIL